MDKIIPLSDFSCVKCGNASSDGFFTFMDYGSRQCKECRAFYQAQVQKQNFLLVGLRYMPNGYDEEKYFIE